MGLVTGWIFVYLFHFGFILRINNQKHVLNQVIQKKGSSAIKEVVEPVSEKPPINKAIVKSSNKPFKSYPSNKAKWSKEGVTDYQKNLLAKTLEIEEKKKDR